MRVIDFFSKFVYWAHCSGVLLKFWLIPDFRANQYSESPAGRERHNCVFSVAIPVTFRVGGRLEPQYPACFASFARGLFR